MTDFEPISQSERLKQFRKSKKLSQKEFAEVIGVYQPNLSKYESGNKNITNDMLYKLYTYEPDLNLDWLLTGRGSMFYSTQIHLKIQTEEQSLKDAEIKLLKEKVQHLESMIIKIYTEDKK